MIIKSSIILWRDLKKNYTKVSVFTKEEEEKSIIGEKRLARIHLNASSSLWNDLHILIVKETRWEIYEIRTCYCNKSSSNCLKNHQTSCLTLQREQLEGTKESSDIRDDMILNDKDISLSLSLSLFPLLLRVYIQTFHRDTLSSQPLPHPPLSLPLLPGVRIQKFYRFGRSLREFLQFKISYADFQLEDWIFAV